MWHGWVLHAACGMVVFCMLCAVRLNLHQVFDMMPIAALVDDIAFCVHGGIGHHVTSVAQVEKIKRPCKVCLFAAHEMC